MADENYERQQADLRLETNIAGLDSSVMELPYRPGRLTSLSCPDCHGPLWEIQDGDLLRYRCRVGHAFTSEEMLVGQSDQVEEALWVALNALEESEQLHLRLAEQNAQRHHPRVAERFTEKAQQFHRRASVIRRLLVPAPEDERWRHTPTAGGPSLPESLDEEAHDESNAAT